jgi:hypothetical protein
MPGKLFFAKIAKAGILLDGQLLNIILIGVFL